MRYPPSLLDEIRARLPVSQVVGRRVSLKRQGREFVGLSPFKSEKTPSFTVNDHKGFYHCFASGEHGDIFKFLMLTEGVSFPEAVERLAAEAGVMLPKLSADAERQASENERLLRVTEAAAGFFEAQLVGREGRAALAYLERRAVDATLRRRFRLGYAPEGRSALKEHLARLGISPVDMAAAGLVVAGPDIPVSYDRFRNRVIIPIRDLKNRVIAFGGRALAEGQTPKYLNSNETPLFHKGHVLFNVADARKAAHEGNDLVVVEGYMDVIALARAGIDTAVAPLGTALTPEQITLMWRFSPEPIVCFDGDAAGQKAALRAADTVLPLLEPGKSLRIARLPPGLDPDDLVRTEGPEALRNVLARPASLVDVLWQRERDRAPGDTPERRAALESRIEAVLTAIADKSVRQQYAQELRQRAREHNYQSVRAKGGGRPFVAGDKSADWKTRDRAASDKSARGGRTWVPQDTRSGGASDELLRSPLMRGGPEPVVVEALILKALLNHPWLIDDYAEEIAGLDLRQSALARLRDAILSRHADGAALDTGALATHLKQSGHEDALRLVTQAITHKSDRFAEPQSAPGDVERGWRDVLSLHVRSTLEDELRQAAALLDAEPSAEAFEELNNIRQKLLRTGSH